MNFKIYLRLALVAIVIVTNNVTAQTIIKTNVLPLDPAVRTGRLKNGFTYYIRHNEEPKDRVSMYLVNKVGSVVETEDQRGLAHFMEHMSFNGTEHFPHNKLVDYLQKAGVRFGADLNAYTGFDETVYQLPIPSDKPELLSGGLEIMRDWAQNATLDPKEIDKERGVVLEEKRLGKGARERMRNVYFPLILNNSRYAMRIPIGLDTVLNNFKRPVLLQFYKQWYRPDLQALIIVGDINIDDMERKIKAKFGDLTNPVNEKPRPRYTIPLNGKNQFISVTDKEMTGTQVQVIIKHQSPQLRTAEEYRNVLIKGLFNHMLAGRFAELLRQRNSPLIQGNAGISGLLADLDAFNITIQVKPGELEQGLKAAWRETERLKKYGFTSTELDRAKTYVINGIESAVEEKSKTSSDNYVNEYVAYFLNHTAAPGVDREYGLTKKYLPGISLTDLNQLTAKYITNTNRDILLLAADEDKSNLPGETMVNNWLSIIGKENLKPFDDEISDKPLLNKMPSAGTIKSREQINGINTTIITLSNGVKVLLKPTYFKNNEIVFAGSAPVGTSSYNDQDYPSAANAGSIISSSGVGNYDRGQLSKYLEGKQLSIGTYIDENETGVIGNTTPKYLETTLQLIYAHFTEPRKDTAIFNAIMTRAKAALMNRNNDPGTVFNDTVNAVLGNHNIRRMPTTLKKLQLVNLDKAFQIYQERFSDAGNFTFTFVGSIDTCSIKPLLEKYLGSLPSTATHEQAKDLQINPPSGQIEKTVYRGSEPKATVMLVYSGKYDYSLESNMQMRAMNEILEIRLLQRLREDESGVYSPGIVLNTSKLPEQRYNFTIRFSCAPQNVSNLIASTQDEISKLKASGPLQENLDKWRAEDRSEFEPQLKTNSFWVGYLNGQINNREKLNQLNGYSKLLNAVTTDDIRKFAIKYLSGDNLIKLILLPEHGK